MASKVQLVPKKKLTPSKYLQKVIKQSRKEIKASPAFKKAKDAIKYLDEKTEPKKKEECKCHCHINTGVWGLKKAICCSPTKAIKPIETFKSWHLDIKGERHYTAERETTLEMVGKINELVRAVTNLKK